MLPEMFDAVTRALATERSRRIAPGAVIAAAVAALSLTDSAARQKEQSRRGDRNDNKGRDKNKRCNARHSEKQILRFIAKAAKRYKQSKKIMVRVARCESALDPCAVNRSGPYYGLFQFLKSTWKTTPYRDRSIYDPKAQALATAWMWKQGRKNEWACK